MAPAEACHSHGPKPPDAGQERQFHLDGLRSTLMILGVFLHGSYLYAAGKPWIVKDGDGSRLLLWLNEAIHFFRIPCFFILSGFFTQMLIERKGKIAFIRMRMRRLALPLVSTALLLNPLQAYFIRGSGTGDWKAGTFVASGAFAAFWTGGEWIGHLWFLVYVLLFSFAAAGFWAAWRRMGTRIRAFGSGLVRPLLRSGGLLFLLPVTYVAGTAAPEFIPSLYWNWGGLSAYGLLIYAPYFAFGLLIHRDYRVRESFHRVHPWQILAMPAIAAATVHLAGHARADWILILTRFLHAYLVWTCCSMLFALFRRLLQTGSRVFGYLSEASYSVYLFHHLCVVVLGVWMAGKDWNVLAKFAVVVGLSLSISLAMHHYLVLRFRVLRLLFMGK